MKNSAFRVSSDGGNYLSADEINLILSYLKVIDNPQLDEEALTVMMSPLYGITAEELSLARLGILGYDIDELDDSGIKLNALYDCFAGQSLFCCIASAGGSGTCSARPYRQGVHSSGTAQESRNNKTAGRKVPQIHGTFQ